MSLLPPGLFAQPSGNILGRITSQTDGIVLADAQISIPGSGLQVLSGSEGWYFLTGIPGGRHEVTVALMGYETMRGSIDMEAGGATNLHFELRPAPIEMDELMVEAESNSTRSRGDRRVIGQAELARTQASTVTTLLQGLVAGLTLTPPNGNVGAAGQLRIRGIRSLRENGPLFFVDDVRIGSSNFRGPTGTGGSILAFLDNIDPSNIERIEILHASEATLLYGTDAAGGVILIYTKRDGS